MTAVADKQKLEQRRLFRGMPVDFYTRENPTKPLKNPVIINFLLLGLCLKLIDSGFRYLVFSLGLN